MPRALSSLSRLNQPQAARDTSMRRRSRLEANLSGGRSSARRYLLYAMIALSLALPAALTLRSSSSSKSTNSKSNSPPLGSGAESGDGTGSRGRVQEPGMPSSSSARPRWEGRDVQDLGVVSPLVWRGIGDGIASAPASADDIHVVFSTDCSPYQNYQAILLFHSAEVGFSGSGAVRPLVAITPYNCIVCLHTKPVCSLQQSPGCASYK